MIEVNYIGHMGDDLSVVNAARVSFGKKSKLVCTDIVRGVYAMSKGDTKLIKYLAKHKHISPFGHAFASFHVKAPIFVARQLVKHKKQGSDGVSHPPMHLSPLMNQVLDLYDQMIYDGVAPEQARMVLPQSTMTEWYWSGSLDAFADMCRLRCKEDTQYETRIVADQINDIMKPLFPLAWEALLND